ncbi:unnamed protein product [Anisakis simplex]|uniref:Chromodomain-helicase-DNA-binding protein 6 (inferred by orthology to a human protein) n=1 Tax=Anisakis simplex TaxID=6269 RepID=A0A158PPK9_ANISI|nr:unnamed protein product [Anisakis simplex]
MGLGKTVQTICFLQRVYDYGIHGPFLIVVPLSTIHNWQREFETWTDMNAIVYHGSSASRQLIEQSEFYYRTDDLKSSKKGVVKFDALITTFEMVVCDCEILRKINYHVCVIDEAHRLKNRNCLLSFTVEHRLLLTGTPLQNNIEELFSLLNFLEPQQFHSSSAFLEQFGQCQTEDQVQKLQQILKPMMLRRLKEDVEKTLQPKEETIIEVGAEEQILSEMKSVHPDKNEEELYQHALVQSSGKLVLIAKLLPKLRADGHKVLIFSQMVRVLDIIEEFLVAHGYTFERIDGNVRGDLRQTAIDRFSKKDSDRFVFLLCTRAGGLGINLTAADTVIIFDSDWNPQNDLQAQARCHRIGQTKMVKVYRLITCNTYEREMFDKASLKLGLDKAVLQSTTALKDTSQQLSRKEIEELLKKGAYGAIMDESNEDSKFNEEDIETILLRRTTTITLEAGVKGSTFAKASFNSSTNREDIDIDDPNFWSKWAKKANIDTEINQIDKELILLEPRNRKKRLIFGEVSYLAISTIDKFRFEETVYKSEAGDDSEAEESDASSAVATGKGGSRKRGERKNDRKRRREDEEYRPDELAFNKSEYFKVEKLLAQYGWGRWKAMRDASDLKESVSEADIEHISRTLLLHCIREYRGDEKVREFVWRLIVPKGGHVVGKSLSKGKTSTNNLTNVFHEGWAALPEYNPPAFAVDSSFQRHVHRHANKLLVRMHQLHILNTEVRPTLSYFHFIWISFVVVIGSRSEAIMSGTKASEVDLGVDMNEPFVSGWDNECDKSFLIGAHKHGVENYEAMRSDEALCFATKTIETFPTGAELLGRFRRLLMHFQRKRNDALSALTWSKREEAEFMRVLRSYGVKDDPSTIISWARFRQLSPLLEHKSDSELMEQLYCVLSMCTKQLGNEMSTVDLQRALKVVVFRVAIHLFHLYYLFVEPISARKAQKLMHRMNMMRQIHDWADSLPNRNKLLKLCSNEAMPNGWTTEQDNDLFTVVDMNGLDNISANIAHRPAFQKIIRPEEKTLLRRVAEIYTTLQTKKWNGAASIELLEDSDEERSTPLQSRIRRGRKKGATASGSSLSNGGAAMRDLVDVEKEKMRALVHQSFLQRLEQIPLAAAAAMAQGAFLLPQLLGGTGSPSAGGAGGASSAAALSGALGGLPLSAAGSAQQLSNDQQQQQLALLSSLFGIPPSALASLGLSGASLPSSMGAVTSSSSIPSASQSSLLSSTSSAGGGGGSFKSGGSGAGSHPNTPSTSRVCASSAAAATPSTSGANANAIVAANVLSSIIDQHQQHFSQLSQPHQHQQHSASSSSTSGSNTTTTVGGEDALNLSTKRHSVSSSSGGGSSSQSIATATTTATTTPGSMTSTSAPSSSSTTTTTSTTTASNASGTGAAGSVHRTSSTHHHSSSSTSSTSSAKGSQQQTSGVSPSFAGISANITSTSALPASSLVAATTSSSTSGGSHNASSSSATSGSGSANKHHSTSALINTLNFTELLALANLPPGKLFCAEFFFCEFSETRVPVVNVESGLRLTGDEAPKVKNLGQWLSAHPKFVLDIPSGADTAHRSSSHTATATASTPTSTSKHSNDKSSSSSSEKKTSSSSDRLIAGSGSRSKDDTSVTRHSSRSDQSKDASSSKAVASKSSTTALSLEPGEIPKPSCSSSSAAASSTSLGIGSLAEQPVAVFDRTSGQLLSADRWPSIRSLASWLDKHPDCNVHSSSATLAAAVLSKRYNDRLGGEANILAAAAAALNATSSGIGGGASSSASSLEALQMQLMLQQALMNPSLLSLGGLCGYSPLNPYAMLAAATTTSPSVSSSKMSSGNGNLCGLSPGTAAAAANLQSSSMSLPAMPSSSTSSSAQSSSKTSGGVPSSADLLNPMLASLMAAHAAAATSAASSPSNAAALQMQQQMQSLLAFDPSLLFAAQNLVASSSSSMSGLPSPFTSIGAGGLSSHRSSGSSSHTAAVSTSASNHHAHPSSTAAAAASSLLSSSSISSTTSASSQLSNPLVATTTATSSTGITTPTPTRKHSSTPALAISSSLPSSSAASSTTVSSLSTTTASGISANSPVTTVTSSSSSGNSTKQQASSSSSSSSSAAVNSTTTESGSSSGTVDTGSASATTSAANVGATVMSTSTTSSSSARKASSAKGRLNAVLEKLSSSSSLASSPSNQS